MLKTKFFIIVIGLIALAIVASSSLSGTKTDPVTETASTQGTITNKTTDNSPNLFQTLLGFSGTKTFLLLFLNNTEIRPGGGFIGSYGVIRINKGVPEILKVEGTEVLDYSTPNTNLPEPPGPLGKYVKVDKWYFRDANWSPDFRLSAEKALELYKLEKGIEADNINGVIAITPTVLEELLKIVGPVTVQNEKITADNFLEKIQYEVEYGYVDKGIEKKERKNILSTLASDLLKKVRNGILLHWHDYYTLGQRMIQEKQIMLYATDPTLQAVLASQKWTGEMSQTTGDYMQWVDANLGALKTDRVITRQLQYSVTTTADGALLATASMRYEHAGGIDWRTSQYLSYPRVFVPEGSELISSSYSVVGQKTASTTDFSTGMENGRKWFGAFIDLKPKQTATLTFVYRLPKNIFTNNEYRLTVQKQLGLPAIGLTLNLNFGKPIQTATPASSDSAKYQQTNDLSVDRVFKLNFGR